MVFLAGFLSDLQRSAGQVGPLGRGQMRTRPSHRFLIVMKALAAVNQFPDFLPLAAWQSC
jgi:hypothetical protein